jgi:hypothetical protein
MRGHVWADRQPFSRRHARETSNDIRPLRNHLLPLNRPVPLPARESVHAPAEPLGERMGQSFDK